MSYAIYPTDFTQAEQAVRHTLRHDYKSGFVITIGANLVISGPQQMFLSKKLISTSKELTSTSFAAGSKVFPTQEAAIKQLLLAESLYRTIGIDLAIISINPDDIITEEDISTARAAAEATPAQPKTGFRVLLLGNNPDGSDDCYLYGTVRYQQRSFTLTQSPSIARVFSTYEAAERNADRVGSTGLWMRFLNGYQIEAI